MSKRLVPTRLLPLLLALMLATAALAAETLLEASAPGAYAARFWPDRIVLTYSTEAAGTVSLKLPASAKWAVLDEAPVAPGKVKWNPATGNATIEAPAGAHTLVLGWAGAYAKPAQGQKIPVLLDGKPAGSLECRFDLEKLTAEGTANLPVGTVSVRLVGLKTGLTPALSAGGGTVTEWNTEGEAREALATQGATPLSLVLRGYNLLKSPVTAIELKTLQAALEPKRLEKMPGDAIVMEAESPSGEGLGKMEVSSKHFELHGGKGIMNNSGEGHWLEYKFTVVQAGTYDLFVRAATQEPQDLRSIQIDGKTPEGLGLVRFPGTGGWGYSAQEWAALQLTGIDKVPSLKLQAGEHTLRITGQGASHLNLDYFNVVGR